MLVNEFTENADGIDQGGVGYLYYAIHERYVKDADCIEAKIHFLRGIVEGDGSTTMYPIIGQSVIVRELYKFKPMSGRLILVIPAILTDLNVKIAAVEISILDEGGKTKEVLFVVKRSGKYSDPYRPMAKIVTRAVVEENEYDYNDPCNFSGNRDCNRLITEILQKSRQKNDKVEEPVKMRETDLDPAAPYILFPKDTDTPLVPFWFTHDHWRYFDRKFQIEDGRVPLVRIEQYSFASIAHGLFLSAHNTNTSMIPPRGSKRTLNEVRSDFTDESQDVLVNYYTEDQELVFTTNRQKIGQLMNYVFRSLFNVLVDISPQPVACDYYKVGKGKMYGCISIRGGVMRPSDYFMLNHHAFAHRYRIFLAIYADLPKLGDVDRIKLHIHRGQLVGLEMGDELVFGSKDVDMDVYNDYLLTLKNMGENFRGLSTDLTQSYENKIDQMLRVMAAEAVYDLPFSVEISETLDMYIKHPLIFGEVVSHIRGMNAAEENSMMFFNNRRDVLPDL